MTDSNPWQLPPTFKHLHSGKVRDLYQTPEGNLLMIASDRISAFDYVLSSKIPDKGKILTALSLWWFDQLTQIVPNHLISTDVPASVTGRAVIVEKLEMLPIECVVRGYLVGSGFQDYELTGSICGHKLPKGLQLASKLPTAIFTPATKAEMGEHDQNISMDAVINLIGTDLASKVEQISLEIYNQASQIALNKGVVLADTKFEFGVRSDGTLVLADEVLTPDSSRFWDPTKIELGSSPESFDKQFVRNWLLSKESGWQKDLTPPPVLPDQIISQTAAKYQQAYQLLTGNRWEI
ncbi:MAG: phosphoribosylaminoimidazole-succinocarboxamide synthase [actinobacterium acAMD-5]|nr:MAG: phosphoribosylaminoimidazole-succinocarboxamide synthase [actinobacterium acAMD-5]